MAAAGACADIESQTAYGSVVGVGFDQRAGYADRAQSRDEACGSGWGYEVGGEGTRSPGCTVVRHTRQ